MRNPCPNDEILVDYLEGRLSGTRQSQIESHLTVCADCREQVGVFLQITSEDTELETSSTPELLTQKAVQMVTDLNTVEQSRHRFQGARRWIAKGIALLEYLAPTNGTEPVMVRSTDADLAEQYISRKKQFDDLAVTIEIERSGQDEALIRVVGTESEAHKQPVRITLFRGDREVASMVMANTPVVFDDIAFGAYRLNFMRKGNKIGEYAFEITVDAEDSYR